MWSHIDRGSSPVDWCEENYTFSPHIAELFNTVSNILFFIIPPFLIHLHRDYARHCGAGQIFSWLCNNDQRMSWSLTAIPVSRYPLCVVAANGGWCLFCILPCYSKSSGTGKSKAYLLFEGHPIFNKHFAMENWIISLYSNYFATAYSFVIIVAWWAGYPLGCHGLLLVVVSLKLVNSVSKSLCKVPSLSSA